MGLNSDPTWKFGVGNLQPTKTQRFIAMVTLTAVSLLCVMGPVLLFDFPFSAVLVCGHGVLPPAPEVLADGPDTQADAEAQAPKDKPLFSIDLSKAVSLS